MPRAGDECGAAGRGSRAPRRWLAKRRADGTNVSTRGPVSPRSRGLDSRVVVLGPAYDVSVAMFADLVLEGGGVKGTALVGPARPRGGVPKASLTGSTPADNVRGPEGNNAQSRAPDCRTKALRLAFETEVLDQRRGCAQPGACGRGTERADLCCTLCATRAYQGRTESAGSMRGKLSSSHGLFVTLRHPRQGRCLLS